MGQGIISAEFQQVHVIEKAPEGQKAEDNSSRIDEMDRDDDLLDREGDEPSSFEEENQGNSKGFHVMSKHSPAHDGGVDSERKKVEKELVETRKEQVDAVPENSMSDEQKGCRRSETVVESRGNPRAGSSNDDIFYGE